MIRFQCPLCRGIIASDVWEPGGTTLCACCSKEVPMPQDRLQPGCMVGDFLLVGELGAGGMGVVFKAHQLSLDRPAAIKILKPEISQDREAVQAFISEARSAAKLNHPNIVQAYAVGEDSGIFYFAMEYIDGVTMKEVLQEKGKIPPKEAARVILQTAQALECAWREQKLVHHDIKPDNIMLCSDNRVKLADLGLAQVFGEDADDDSDEVAGTPQYISPEQMLGVVTDTRSDIYSLGATFFHLVTGRFAYVAENTDEIAKLHVYGTLTPPKEIEPGLPDEVNNIIVKMMAKAPENRYQDCSELIQSLKNYLNASGTPSVKMNTPNMQTLNPGGNNVIQPKPSNSGGGVMPKIAVPASPLKISIKGVDKKAEEPAVPAAAPATPATPAAPAAPKITLNLSRKPNGEPSKIKLNNSNNAAVEPAAVPAEEENVQADSDETPEVVKVEKSEEKVPESANEKTENAAAETPEKLQDEKTDSDVPAEAAGTDVEPKRKSAKVFWLLLIVVLVLGSGGAGGWFYYEKFMKKTATAPEKPVEKPSPAVPEVKAEPVLPVAPAVPEVKVELAKQVVPDKLVLSPFMTRVKQFEDILFSSEQRFLSAWRSGYKSLKPVSAEEKNAYTELENKYVEIDERLNVEPNRKRRFDAHNSLVANRERQAAVKEFNEHIAKEEKAAFDLAESSAANYRKDLSRKMGILDHAMITSAKSRRPADWEIFLKAVESAKAEPARVADRPDFVPTAKELAVYAEQLKLAAEQGRDFTANLQRNAFAKKQIEGNGVLVKVVSSNAVTLNLSVQYENAAKPFVPKKLVYSKKGKAKPKPNAKPKAAVGKRYGKAKIEKLNLQTMPLEDVDRWVSFVEQAWGKGDQYFYYMLYNGNMRSRLSVIAPDEYWAKHVDRIPRRYFRRAIFLANPQQLENLKKTYGEWLSFKNALKEFEKQK